IPRSGWPAGASRGAGPPRTSWPRITRLRGRLDQLARVAVLNSAGPWFEPRIAHPSLNRRRSLDMVARRVSNRQNPDRRLQETRGLVNVDFFRRWTPDMAYVLGYFAADGCAVRNQRGSHYLRFDSVDRRR